MENSRVFDLIIVGSGPAGLTASIYASCYHLSHLVIGKELGGQLQLAPDILNYPGFESVAGKELTQKMVDQVKLRGGELVTGSVTRIISRSSGISRLDRGSSTLSGHDAVTTHSSQTASGQLSNYPISTNNPIKQISDKDTSDGGPDVTSGTPPRWRNQNKVFELETQEGDKYQAKSIILATGTERRKLNVPGEVEYTSKGVHYCATCEKFDYEGKVCAVVGGANSAVQAAVELSQVASRVYIIYRGRELRGDPVWLEQVEKHPNIEVIYNTVVTEIVGDREKVTGVRINTNNPINQKSDKDTSDGGPDVTSGTPPRWRNQNALVSIDKLFIEIGGVPGTALVIPLGVAMDPGGYIHVNERLSTNVPGVFAAGDLVSYALSIEQISSAVGLGARAAASAFAYLKGEKAPSVWGGSQIKR